MLFTPRECSRPEHRTMAVDEVKRALSVLELRERLIFKLAVLAGAIREVPNDLREHAARFAAQSDSFAKLTKEEQRLLDEFVGFLRSDR